MYHFMARLGRKPWFKFVMPTVSCAASFAYLAPHYMCHSTVRKLFTAENSDGFKEEICPELKKVIVDSFEDIKADFNKPIQGFNLYFSSWKPIIKWFATSSLHPQVFGMVETYTGVLIGLPYYYNYEKVSELPSQVYQFKKLSLFKSFSSKTKQETDELSSETTSDSISVDSMNPAGEAYLDSLIFSEKAKKFSIARELFYADSYRVMAKATVIFISAAFPVALSRAAVSKLKLTGYHITFRIPFYLVAGLAGLGHYYILGDALDKHYDQKADMRAQSTSQDYKEGSIEYFSKLLQRNKALRDLSKEFESMFDEKGNIVEGLFRNRYTPLTERLEQAVNCQVSPVNSTPASEANQ